MGVFVGAAECVVSVQMLFADLFLETLHTHQE